MERYYNKKRKDDGSSSSPKEPIVEPMISRIIREVELDLNDIIGDPGMQKPIEEFDVAIRDDARRTCRWDLVNHLGSLAQKMVETVMNDLKYAESHEWVKVEGSSVTIGITDHALDHLGNVIFVELPDDGAEVHQGARFGTVETVKSTSDINSPVSGKVVAVNTELTGSPGLVNASPYERGWMIKVEMANNEQVKSLMDPEQYSKFCHEE